MNPVTVPQPRTWRPPAGVVPVSCALLLLTLCWGVAGVEAHPGTRAMGTPAVGFSLGDPERATSAVPPAVPAASLAPPRETPSAWAWVALLAVPGIRAARRWGGRRSLALATGLVLAAFAVEGAIHAVHHLNDPRQAERCPVYSASLHVIGLGATPSTPDLPPPAPSCQDAVARIVQHRSPVLGGPQSRAPPHPARVASPRFLH